MSLKEQLNNFSQVAEWIDAMILSCWLKNLKDQQRAGSIPVLTTKK
jgi:hypothetical protein